MESYSHIVWRYLRVVAKNTLCKIMETLPFCERLWELQPNQLQLETGVPIVNIYLAIVNI